MRIAPIDIAHKTFHRKMMGYDPEETVAFMKMVAEDFEVILRERNALKETLREKEMNLADYRERDELLKATITTATRMSEKMQVDAEREAKLILHDANQRAETIVREARDSIKRLYNEISDLKRMRLQFENNMKALLQSHMQMLDQGLKIMPNPAFQPRIDSSFIEEDEASSLKARIAESIQKNL